VNCLSYSSGVLPTKYAVLLILVTLSGCRRAGGIAGETTIRGLPARVPHFATAPAIDGRLDEGVWQTATVLGPFVDRGDGHDVSANHPVAATAGYRGLG
jgi:hypothetical protein